MELRREWLEKLIFESAASRRFTQDSPILPDVWIAYGEAFAKGEDRPLDLLLTPHAKAGPGELYRAVHDRLTMSRREGGRFQVLRSPGGALTPWDQRGTGQGPEGHDLAANQSTVVVRLYFDELVTVLLPLTDWWQTNVCRAPGRQTVVDLATQAGLDAVEEDIERIEKGQTEEGGPADLLWLVKLVGSIVAAAQTRDPGDWTERAREWETLTGEPQRLARHFREFVVDPQREMGLCPRLPVPRPLHMVSRNRPASLTVAYSVQAVKADAARRLFQASCEGLAWAIVDSGIDATHPAFRRRDADKPLPEPFPASDDGCLNQTRVEATFDFTRVRHLLAGSGRGLGGVAKRISDRRAAVAAERAVLERKAGGATNGTRAGLQARVDWLGRLEQGLAREQERWETLAQNPDAEEAAVELRRALLSGRMVDWDKVRPLIEISPETYLVPKHEHGTHVAGILAADWRADDWPEDDPQHTGESLVGVCPDIRLYDFRVFDDEGVGDEFSVMAALQFMRHLNGHRDLPAVHGANLSLAIQHDVRNYACGRTPVCDEAERVVNSGMVVVAAAGNFGYNRFATLTDTGAASTLEGYADMSISDPGNAQAVITVGSTHRIEPHTYGVSFFSSRGPTGDGRYKPDLVAPGEKIQAPIPGNGSKVKDGTSMAAPHVSGAAALILARYREFVGRPDRVKQILCATATDLGRDRYFQGAGMVDVLRALQSV